MTRDVIARSVTSFDDVCMTETATVTTTDTADHQAVIDGYFACWNATDDADRLAVVERTWAADATSSDPLAAVTGHAELTEMFAAFHVTYAGSSFRQKGGVDAHPDLVRWGWEMVGPDGTVLLDGIDVAVIDSDGRIAHLAGFFGFEMPSGAAAAER